MSDRYQNEKGRHLKKEQKQTIVIILAIITLLALCVTIWAVFFRKPATQVLNPDYAVQEPEKNAEQMEDSGKDKLKSPAGGGAVSITYTKDVTISLSNKKATLMFGNPSESNQDMVLELQIQDKVIAQSGRLSPGHKVTTLDLTEGAETMLQAGGYDGKIVVYYYNQETEERAVLNTEVIVNIKVNQ